MEQVSGEATYEQRGPIFFLLSLQNIANVDEMTERNLFQLLQSGPGHLLGVQLNGDVAGGWRHLH